MHSCSRITRSNWDDFYYRRGRTAQPLFSYDRCNIWECCNLGILVKDVQGRDFNVPHDSQSCPGKFHVGNPIQKFCVYKYGSGHTSRSCACNLGASNSHTLPLHIYGALRNLTNPCAREMVNGSNRAVQVRQINLETCYRYF